MTWCNRDHVLNIQNVIERLTVMNRAVLAYRNIGKLSDEPIYLWGVKTAVDPCNFYNLLLIIS